LKSAWRIITDVFWTPDPYRTLMQEPNLQHLIVGDPAAHTGAPRRMAYWDWPCAAGDGRHVVVCVHGLSRQGRDFDTLARALSERSRVVAVDVAGRGRSDWLADPMRYQVPTYAADLAALLTHLRAQTPGAVIDWVGTSMGPHTPEQWRALSRPLLREREGRWWLHYDPAIAVPLKALTGMADQTAARQLARDGEAALWGLYDAITAPTLLLRGQQSDLLTSATAAEMGRRGPKARCVVFEGVGHAPTLVADDQVAAIRDFLWSD
jgi:pimeloyl-ACP methyl ester carboxylesterase